MKRLIIFIAALLISSTAIAGQTVDGKAAFDKGDYQTAFQLLQDPAEHGDAVAQYDIGVMYEWGWGGAPQDFTRAMTWLLKSAEQGCSSAQHHVSSLYAEGMGVPQDKDKANYWSLKNSLGGANDKVKCKEVAMPPSLQNTYTPPDGVIPNAATAIKVGIAILTPIYGERVITEEQPFTATLANDTWTVSGHLPNSKDGGVMVGGVAEIDLSKSKGCVSRIIHGQ